MEIHVNTYVIKFHMQIIFCENLSSSSLITCILTSMVTKVCQISDCMYVCIPICVNLKVNLSSNSMVSILASKVTKRYTDFFIKFLTLYTHYTRLFNRDSRDHVKSVHNDWCMYHLPTFQTARQTVKRVVSQVSYFFIINNQNQSTHFMSSPRSQR